MLHVITHFDNARASACFLRTRASTLAEDIAHNIHAQRICRAADANRHPHCQHDRIAIIYQSAALRNLHYRIKYTALRQVPFIMQGFAAPNQVHLPPSTFVRRTSHNRANRPVLCNHTRCKTGLRYRTDAGCIQFRRRCACRKADSICNIHSFRLCLAVQLRSIFHAALSLLCNARHCSHRLDGIIAHCGLSGKHDRIAAVKNSIRNVVCLGSCRAWAVYHAFQHLCCCNNRLAPAVRLCNQYLLHKRHFLCRDFHTQVTAGNHDAVRNLQNAVDVIHALLVFNFRNNLYIFAAEILQNSADICYVCSTADKGCRYNIETIFHTEFQIGNILFRQGRQVHFNSRDIYTLIGAQIAAIDNNAVNILRLNALHLQLDEPVIQKHA